MALAGTVAGAEPVSLKDLFRDYDHFQMKMSPDGRYLASIFEHEPVKKRPMLGLGLFDLDTGVVKPLQRSHDVSTLQVDWTADNRMIASLINTSAQRSRYSMLVDGSELKEIVQPTYWSVLGDADMIHRRGPGEDEVLVARPKYGRFAEARGHDGVKVLPGVYRLNVRTGEYSLMLPDPAWTREWFCEPSGRVRVAVGFDPNAFRPDGRIKDKLRFPGRKIFWVDDAGVAEEIHGVKMDLGEEFRALGFEAGGGRFLFAGRQGADRAAVYAYNSVTRQVEGPVFAHEIVDIDSAVISEHDATVAGVWINDGVSRVEWFDPELKRLQQAVDAALPGRTNFFSSWARSKQRVLILSYSADEPGLYYLLDRKTGRISEMYRRAEWLKNVALGRTQPIQLMARDGVTLHGYLTIPPGAREREARATVLMVHGGPWGIRDFSSFDPEVQFFATRGYNVLRVNYRGSGGYGRRFEELSHKQFGKTMQDDLFDAVDWAVREGHADPERLVICGGSYGGYAALMGGILAPKRFRAVITQFPVTDLARQVAFYEKAADVQFDRGFAYQIWKDRVGDPAVDGAEMKALSPLYRLHRLEAPVFVVYGENDPIIEFSQPADLVKGLRALRKKFTRVAPPDERHGLFKAESRYEVYEAMEKFLRQHAPAN